jgi:signal transduction histidine kinase
MCDGVTAVLLFSLYAVHAWPPLHILAMGYLFAGLTIVPWALSFPQVAVDLGFTAPDLQSMAWFGALRRLGFPLFVLAYAVLKRSEVADDHRYPSAHRRIWLCAAAAIAAAASATWLVFANAETLPAFMMDERRVAALWHYVPIASIVLCLAGLARLWTGKRHRLDIWVMVALVTWLVEIILLAYVSGGMRLTMGWWAGRLCGLASSSVVLVALLADTATLHARLARSMTAERRAREARVSSLEALSASVAHEVNQPVASMITNANAGLRWLDRHPPDLDETRAALLRIVNDGHRTGNVIEGIRAVFDKGDDRRLVLEPNGLVGQCTAEWRHEAHRAGIAVEVQLDPRAPKVYANPVQLQQVLSNLISNAIQAMQGRVSGPKTLCVTTSRQETGDLRITVRDSGPGISPVDLDRIFEPFFTTKPDGMGMGLMFCRSVSEAHGGRRLVSPTTPSGASYEFTLPAADLPEATVVER